MGARIAAIDLFEVDVNKPWNYLGHCYEKAPSLPLPHFWKGRGGNAPAMPPVSGASCTLFYTSGSWPFFYHASLKQFSFVLIQASLTLNNL